jgi:hypothetical protein
MVVRPSNAQAARESVRLTLQMAAKRVRITPRYLRHVELHGAPYVLARRLAALYQCPMALFLGGGTLKTASGRGGSRPEATHP